MTEERATRSPRVSVIIPTKNRGPLLQRAVASVLTQTLGDFEILVVDDASTDDAARRIAESDPRIRYLRHERSRGHCAAKNTGVRAARGAYLAFLDDDDLWLPQKLERQVRALDDAPSDVGVVYTGMQWFDVDGRAWRADALVSGDVYEALFGDMRGLPVNNVTLMVRRECFDDVGLFDEDLVHGDAWDMYVRLARRWRFAAVADPLAVIRRPGSGISGDPKRVAAGRRRLVGKFAAELAVRPRANSGFHLVLGVLELKLGNAAQARKDLGRAIAAWPKNWKAAAYLLLTFQPRVVRDWLGSLWKSVRVLHVWSRRRKEGHPRLGASS